MLVKISNFLLGTFIIVSLTVPGCICGGGSGSKSDTRLVNPENPTSIVVTSDTAGELNITWAGNKNDGRYKVIIDDSNPFDGSPVKILETAVSPLKVAVSGGDYYVWVLKVNYDGSEGTPYIANDGTSITVDPVNQSPVAVDPDDPGQLSLTSSANGQIEVSWTGDPNDGSYQVVVDDDNILDDDAYLVSKEGAASPAILTGLDTGTYYAWIIAVNTDGSQSAFAVDPDGVSVLNPGTVVPDPPSNVVSVTPGLGEIKVTWTGDSNDGSYKVVIDNDSSYSNDIPEYVQSGAVSPFLVNNLSSSNYYVWVVPVDPDGTEGTAVIANSGNPLMVYNGTLDTADDTWNVYEGMSTSIPTANLLANDANNMTDDPLEIVSVKDAVNGTVSLDGSMITFTSTGTAGVDAAFTYTARIKDNDQFTVEGTVTITVDAKPSVVANSDTTTLQQGGEIYFSANALLLNDVGNNLQLTAVLNAVNGTVSKTGDNITFVSTGLAYEPAQFDYKILDDLGTEATGTVFITVNPLPPLDAYIYDDISVFDEQKLLYAPPTVQNIFDSWGRFDGNEFYDNVNASDGNATSWQFLTDPDRVSMPLNVDPYNGFVSLQAVENYTFEATLSSPDNDNDTIGLIIAFVRLDTDDDGVADTNYALNALRTQGGTEPKTGWGVTYGTGTTGAKYNDVEWIIEEKEVGATAGSWKNGGNARVKIVRTGDIIKCYTTKWNNTGTYEATSEIVIDLNSDPRLAKFKGARSYGYSTFSQPDSTYLDISFDGGIDTNTMMFVDWDTGIVQIWEYDTDEWVVTEKTIQEVVGYVRIITNPVTGKQYLVKKDSIEPVE